MAAYVMSMTQHNTTQRAGAGYELDRSWATCPLSRYGAPPKAHGPILEHPTYRALQLVRTRQGALTPVKSITQASLAGRMLLLARFQAPDIDEIWNTASTRNGQRNFKRVFL
jgi:hypothetical protein